MKNLKIISAGAGSGKTYSLTQEMAKLLTPDQSGKAKVRASGIIATTFTNKAAAELKERVRIELLEGGLTKEADELGNAMIGTVHSIGVQLLKRFAFEAGVSPEVDIIADSDQQMLFNLSISSVLSVELIHEMSLLSDQLGFEKSPYNKRDWRRDLKSITDIARANNFDVEVLLESKQYSVSSFFGLLPEPSANKTAAQFNSELLNQLINTVDLLENNDDATKKKQSILVRLKGYKNSLTNKGFLCWHEWAAISKLKPSKKSRDDVFDLIEFAQSHNTHPGFHLQIRTYVNNIFDAAIAAVNEYENYKKSRGLIDYIDMEVLILKLLENDVVCEVLSDEIDLLLVDEFQDTNPLQLKIFLKLSQIATESIWVGDPKQSIYGFRGAAPDLMKAVMDNAGNIANLPDSWRSREDLVNLCNGLFVRALEGDMPVERIALNTAPPFVKAKESAELKPAAHHWHFQYENRAPGKAWIARCIARAVAEVLEEGWMVRIKGSNELRKMQAGDVAVLCRSNYSCQVLAEAFSNEGIKASVSRSGLLETAEAKLVLACLRFILNKYDALAVAEILLLAAEHKIEDVIVSRLDFLDPEKVNAENKDRWGQHVPYIQKLSEIRRKCKELSSGEILNCLIEKLDVRRTVAAWSNNEQRLDNIDALRKLASDYQDTCIRLNSASTLGGFLQWLDDLAADGNDEQGKGAGANAVNVLTYHKSKGLEWPFVVCHNLDNDLKDNIWGVRIVRTLPNIDISKPLANRLLCYWVNPYSDQVKGTDLMEAVGNTEAGTSVKKNSLDEEIRLLYVGLTRARDYLVFPSLPKKPVKWLNRVFHHGEETVPVLDVGKPELPWMWSEKEIMIQTNLYNFERNMPAKESVEEAVDYLKPHAGEQNYKAAFVDSVVSLFPALNFSFEGQESFCKPFCLTAGEELRDATLRLLLNTYILADNPTGLDSGIRSDMARNLLAKNNVSAQITAADLMAFSARFYEWIYNKYKVLEIFKYKSFRYVSDVFGQLESSVDFVVLTEDKRLILLNFLVQDVLPVAKYKSKFKEIVCLHEAAAKALQEEFGVGGVDFMLVQSLEGILAGIIVKKLPLQSSLF